MASSKLIDFLSTADEFRVHTGNISSWGELRLRTFNSSSDELVECLKLQLAKWEPSDQELEQARENQKKGGSHFTLLQCPFCMPCHAVGKYPRDDLKVTVKAFLSKPDAQDVREGLLHVNRELDIEYTEQLIVALPEPELGALVEPCSALQLKEMWPDLERLVDEGHVAALGVSDLSAHALGHVWEIAPNIKPLVNHYDIEGSGPVPQDLAEFARKHDVVLVSHNDPRPFFTNDQVSGIFTETLGIPPELAETWAVNWAARYTVIVKSRAVIGWRGYVVHFERKK